MRITDGNKPQYTLKRDAIARELGVMPFECLADDRRPWHTVVCSRLGRNLLARSAEISMIPQFIERAAARGDRTLVVHGTAAHPWSDRACELIGVQPLRLSVHHVDDAWQTIDLGPAWCQDKLAIELADRVDATFVRANGTVERLLTERLQRQPNQSSTVQILVTKGNQRVARRLIAAGAVGYLPAHLDPVQAEHSPEQVSTEPDISNRLIDSAVRSLVQHPDRWLVHSTRQRTGPWPGQSPTQFNDWLLLSRQSAEPPSALQTLRKIIHEQRLIGSHRTISGDHAVVCFTALPIVEWLSKRQFRSHLGRWDAEPYGIAISRTAANRHAVMPVIYGDKVTLASLPHNQQWRYQARGETYDWTSEHEWRKVGILDISQFADDEVIVFVKQMQDVAHLGHCRWPIVAVDRLGIKP